MAKAWPDRPGADPQGLGVVNIINGNQNDAVRITEENGSGFINVSDPAGGPLAWMHANSLGNGTLEIFNSDATIVSQVTTDGSFDHGFVGVGNSDGLPIVSITGNKPGQGMVSTFGETGLLQTRTGPSNFGGAFTAFNNNETPVSLLGVDEAGGGVYVAARGN